jgi:hypothetical protein
MGICSAGHQIERNKSIPVRVWCVHIVTQPLIHVLVISLNSAVSFGVVRCIHLLYSQKFTSLFKKHWGEWPSLISHQNCTRAMCRYRVARERPYASFGSNILYGFCLWVLSKMVNESQKILILSWGERIWSTNIHGSNLKRVGRLWKFFKGCRVFAPLFSPVTLVTLSDIVFNVLSHSRPIVPNTQNYKCPFPSWVCCENGNDSRLLPLTNFVGTTNWCSPFFRLL